MEQTGLIKVIHQAGLESTAQEMVLGGFHDFEAQALKWKEAADKIVVTSEHQTEAMGEARKARLALRSIRTDVEKRRKELKEDSLRYGKAIDSVGNYLKGLIEPIEESLEQKEKFAEIQKELRRQKLLNERTEKISSFVAVLGPMAIDLASMSEDEFNQHYNLLERMCNEKEAKRIKDEADALNESRCLMLQSLGAEVEKDLRYDEVPADEWNKKLAQIKEHNRQLNEQLQLERVKNEEARQQLKQAESARAKAEADAIQQKRITDAMLNAAKEMPIVVVHDTPSAPPIPLDGTEGDSVSSSLMQVLHGVNALRIKHQDVLEDDEFGRMVLNDLIDLSNGIVSHLKK